MKNRMKTDKTLFEDMPVKGFLTIKEIDKKTGEVLSEYDEQNVITREGFANVLSRISRTTVDDEDVQNMFIKTIVLGDDIGNGTIFNPSPATSTLTSIDQSVVYEVPENDMNFNYVSSTTLELNTVLDGTVILDALFPEEVDMRYTSATIRFHDGKTLSYKRFPIRSLSRLVDVQINWRIILDECAP